jgi:hypothetical protein
VGWYPVSDLELRRSSNPLCCPQTRAIGVYADRARVKMRGQAVLQGGRSVPCHYLDVGGPGFDPSSSLQDSISPLHSQPPTRRSIRPTWSLSQALANPSQRRISIPSQLYNVTFLERVARPRLWRRAHSNSPHPSPHSVHKLAHKTPPRIHKCRRSMLLSGRLVKQPPTSPAMSPAALRRTLSATAHGTSSLHFTLFALLCLALRLTQ